MKTVKINLYTLDELDPKDRERAINEHAIFLDSIPEEYEDESENMLSEYMEHEEADIIDSIESNGYLFYKDGKIANCVGYVGKHPKAGTTELTLNGEIYTL